MSKARDLYLTLAQSLQASPIAIRDSDFFGYCFDVKKNSSVIIIYPRMSWENKLFVLAHEISHLAYLSSDGYLNIRKRTANEDKANQGALKILEALEFNKEDEYWLFYKKALKRNKIRKKSWHEV